MLDKKYNAEEKERSGLTTGKIIRFMNLKEMEKKYIQ